MSKTCPNCKRVFDDDEFICGNCGVNLVDTPEKPNPTLNLGDANAISGGVSINQSKNITSHDVHYHTMQEIKKSEKEIKQEQLSQYYEESSRLFQNGVITPQARTQLNKLRINFEIDSDTADRIEKAVINEQKTQAHAANDQLSISGEAVLGNAITAIEQNNPKAGNYISKLAAICKTTSNEKAHFYYNLLLAACDPVSCVKLYKERTVDSYWQTYWASLAYRKIGEIGEGEVLISDLNILWQEYPKLNVIINACVGILFAYDWNVEKCKKQIVDYLIQSNDQPSECLNDLYHSLLFLVGVEVKDNSKYAFYKKYFLSASAVVVTQENVGVNVNNGPEPVMASQTVASSQVVQPQRLQDRIVPVVSETTSSLQNPTEDKPSVLLKLLSFCVPMIGWVLYFIYKEDRPATAKSCSKWAWIGIGVTLLFNYIYFLS